MRLFYVTLIILSFSACTKKAADTSASSDQLKSLDEKGRTVYVANCTSCHGVDPKKDGTLGPAIFGSGLELIEEKVLNGTYPENYKPKRETKVMQKFPFLKNEIKALHAYLNTP